MSDSAFRTAPYSGYTTEQLRYFIAQGAPASNGMQAEVERREKVAQGDVSVMTPGERLRAVRKVFPEPKAQSSFTASVETDAGTYQHGYHLGTQEDLARNIIEEIARGVPRQGTRIVTVALMKDGKIEDVFDGKDWVNDLDWEDV